MASMLVGDSDELSELLLVVSSEFFIDRRLGAMLGSMRKLHELGVDITESALAHDLSQSDTSGNLVGDKAALFISSVLSDYPFGANAKSLADEVRGNYQLRLLREGAARLYRDASSLYSDSLNELVRSTEKLVDDVLECESHGGDSTEKSVAYINQEIQNLADMRRPDAWDTGHPSIGRFMVGYEPGSIHVVCGEIGSGKTHFMFMAAQLFAERNGVKPALVSLEMGREELLRRQVVGVGPYASVVAGEQPNLVAAGMRAERFAAYPVTIESPDTPSPSSAMALIDRLARLGHKMVVLDPLQALVWPSRDSTANVAAFINALKAMAMRRGITLVIVSQLNRVQRRGVGGARRAPFTFTMDDTYGHEGAYASRAAHTVSLLIRPAVIEDDSTCLDICNRVKSQIMYKRGMSERDAAQAIKRLVIQRVVKNRTGGAAPRHFCWMTENDGRLVPCDNMYEEMVVQSLAQSIPDEEEKKDEV